MLEAWKNFEKSLYNYVKRFITDMFVVKFLISMLSVDPKRSVNKHDLESYVSSKSVKSFSQQYVPWSSAKDHLQHDDYCSYNDFLTALEDIKGIDLNSIDTRNEALEILNNIRIEKLVAKKKRFPANGFYVNLTSSVCAELFNDIIDALDCKNNCASIRRQILTCNCTNIFYTRLSLLFDLHYEYLIDELYHYGVYNRENFEEWHALTWV